MVMVIKVGSCPIFLSGEAMSMYLSVGSNIPHGFRGNKMVLLSYKSMLSSILSGYRPQSDMAGIGDPDVSMTFSLLR